MTKPPADSTRADRPRLRRGVARLAVIAAACVAVLLGLAGPAHAQFGFVDGETAADAFKADGVTPETQAGAVPHEAKTVFELNSTTELVEADSPPYYRTLPDDNVKDIQVDLPRGMIGDPKATPQCPRAALVRATEEIIPCPVSTQVGTVKLYFGGRDPFPRPPTPEASFQLQQYPVFNIEPREGDLAQFTFVVYAFGPTNVVGSVRVGDYGVRTDIRNISVVFPLVRSELTLWGVPADPSHDALRGYAEVAGFPFNPGGASSGVAPKPFLRLPTACDGTEQVTEFRARSWQDPTVWKTDSAAAPPITGCDKLSFTPTMDARPDTSAPDTPAGLSVDIDLPQTDDPDVPASPHLRNATVTLPEGMTINPASAGGLKACSDAQLKLGSDDPVECPAGSRIGSVEATSPTLDETLRGGVFVRSQASNDPESGEMFRLALVLESAERGVSVRLPGSIRADARTGRLVAEFANNPQLPVDHIGLRLKSGPRAPLATPAECGPKTIEATLTSWAGQSIDLQSEFDIDCTPGLGSFGPSFEAGTAIPAAGASSPFALRVEKPDGQSDLNGIDMLLPEGLLANLKGNLGKQVGTAHVAAGPGASPFWLSGPVVLEGAYGDAPYSLRVTVPVIAGPFNLGEVVVRQKIYVDPVTARVMVVSDPLPTIVRGVPVRLQSLNVDIDKPDFVVNPTDCQEKSIHATLGAVTGQTAAVSTRFQVGDCAALGFEPKIRLALKGRRQVKTGGHPAVRAVVRQGDDEAAIRRAVVRLPKSLALDPDNAQALCEFEDGTKPDLENHCPAGSIVGRARAVTPLLDHDLVGDVYFVKNVRIDPDTGNELRTLPMLVVALRGEIAINLTGKSSTMSNGRLVNTFARVPDAPISRFNLNIKGGNNGILTVTRTRRSAINLCTARRQVAIGKIAGQNGKRADQRILVRKPCGKRRKAAAAICRKRLNGKAAIRRCVTKVKRNRAQARRAAARRAAKRHTAKRGTARG